MKEIEIMKSKLELSKCRTAKMELEYKIMERMQDIERMKEHIKLQEEREQELLEKIKE